MKRLFLFLLFALTVSTLSAQKDVKNFGKVDGDDFKETVYDVLGYDAVTLLNYRKVYFDVYNGSLRFFNEYRLRIKALKDGVFDSETFEIPFSGRYEYEKVVSPKVIVYAQNGKKIVSHKQKLSTAEYVDRDSLNSKVIVHLPQVKAGEILELRYYFMSFDFMLPPRFEFSGKYPCLKSVLVAEFPEHMRYKFDVYDPENVVYHSENQTFVSMPYTFVPSDNPKSFYYMTSRGRRYNLNFRFSALTDTFMVSNLLPKSEYEEDFTTPKIIFKAYKFTQDTKHNHPIYQAGWQQMTHLLYTYADPDNRYLSQSEAWFKIYNPGFVIIKADSWEYFHKRMRKSPDFWKPVMKSFALNDTLQKIIDGVEFADSIQTIEKLYNFVNQTVEWDGNFKNHIDKNPEKVLKQKSGSSAEKNMTLVALLRRAGFDAFPALAATNDFGRIDTAYADRIQFNHVLAVVRISGECILMDCSEKDTPFRKIPTRDLNNCCWAVAPEKGFFIWF
ncbi:MAG: transglutaminase domain-containing protein [Bacteroidales bacterium]|nr:transglutaminase domain-containing protein [Bacteroidales bacterium]